MKIAVFDSGIGGLTVLEQLLKQTGATHSFVYFGDNANLPYGTKSPFQVQTLCAQAARTLKAKRIDHLVVACNTASSLALDVFQEILHPLPVTGMISPGVAATQMAANTTPDPQTILVLGTAATIKSGAYLRELKRALPQHEILQRACPLFVPMIEESWIGHRLMTEVTEEYLGHYRNNPQTGLVLLGCTHYPWIQNLIEKTLPQWKVINPAIHLAGIFGANDPDSKTLPTIEWNFTDPDSLSLFATKRITQLTGHSAPVV